MGGKWLYKIAALMPQLTIQEALDLALRHHQVGRLAEAEKIHRQILAHRVSELPAYASTAHARYEL